MDRLWADEEQVYIWTRKVRGFKSIVVRYDLRCSWTNLLMTLWRNVSCFLTTCWTDCVRGSIYIWSVEGERLFYSIYSLRLCDWRNVAISIMSLFSLVVLDLTRHSYSECESVHTMTICSVSRLAYIYSIRTSQAIVNCWFLTTLKKIIILWFWDSRDSIVIGYINYNFTLFKSILSLLTTFYRKL